MTNISTATRAELRETLRAMRAEKSGCVQAAGPDPLRHHRHGPGDA